MKMSKGSSEAKSRTKRYKGALHIHSNLSRDGTLSIAELAQWYSSKGYQFLALTEHAEDMDRGKIETLVTDCARYSSENFCLIPGLEFACTPRLHIPAIGVVELIVEKEPVLVVEKIHENNGFAVLAHPRRLGWECPSDILKVVDAAEIWNVTSDGKFLPAPQALDAYRKMSEVNPKLLAITAHDFHRKEGYYDLALHVDLHSLGREAILEALKKGNYSICSRFFKMDAHGELLKPGKATLVFMSSRLRALRTARATIMQWLS